MFRSLVSWHSPLNSEQWKCINLLELAARPTFSSRVSPLEQPSKAQRPEPPVLTRSSCFLRTPKSRNISKLNAHWVHVALRGLRHADGSRAKTRTRGAFRAASHSHHPTSESQKKKEINAPSQVPVQRADGHSSIATRWTASASLN